MNGSLGKIPVTWNSLTLPPSTLSSIQSLPLHKGNNTAQCDQTPVIVLYTGP
jgi:hypothetical protein